jgi:hypothetical protein
VSPEQEVQRAQEAKRLLEHPLLIEAFASIEKEVIERWTQSPASDAPGREKLWLTLKLLHRLRTHLESLVSSGKLAEATLRERVKRALGRTPSSF